MKLMNSEFWSRRRVFLTGHTGFKGSWLSLWLQSMGAKVKGYALPPPTHPNLFEEANVASGMASQLADVRDLVTLSKSMLEFQPDIVIHMAAQPLVRWSYQAPVETYATNVMGTVHMLEAARKTASVKCIVNVTTDKCYENREWVWGYRENEPMGGHDPYSSSKGCSELVTSAYQRSFFAKNGTPALASARAGNVIGGGDWAEDRLIPDILRAFENGEPVIVRNPLATRPWQHVLEPLSGYILLAERLYTDGQSFAEGWNFGPSESDARPVQWIVEHMVEAWGNNANWQLNEEAQPHEAQYLKLDISKARHKLGWEPSWDLATSLMKTIRWHSAWLAGDNIQEFTLNQIADYLASGNKV